MPLKIYVGVKKGENLKHFNDKKNSKNTIYFLEKCCFLMT